MIKLLSMLHIQDSWVYSLSLCMSYIWKVFFQFLKRKICDFHVDLLSPNQSNINPNDLRPAVIYRTFLPE